MIHALNNSKTVLCSNVVNHLQYKQAQRNVLVLFLYLDYKEKDKQTPTNLIGNLVKQLVQHQMFRFRSKELKKMYQASRGETQPNQSEMIHVLREEFRSYSRTYLIVDGWNDATNEVRTALERLLERLRAENVSIMIMSRYAEIESATSEISCTVCHTSGLRIYYHCDSCEQYDLCQSCMDKEESCGNASHGLEEPYDQVYVLVKATDDEIREYVQWEIEKQIKHDEGRRRDKRVGGFSLSTTPLARRIEQKPSLKQSIPNAIVRKAKGIYLLARLYIESLKTMLNVNEIEKALLTLPENLDMVYADKMERIVNQKPRRNADWAREVLYWIVCTQRPLSFMELQHALGVKAGETSYDPYQEIAEADIITTTAGLVAIDFDQRAVRVHITFHEYLQEHRENWFPRADFDIAETILTYLNFAEFDSPCKAVQVQARLDQLPLLSYGSQYWGDHVSRVCSEPGIQNLLLEFVSSPAKLESSLQAAFHLDSKTYSDIDVRKGVNGLHVSALYGLDPIISELVINKGIPIDSIDPTYEQTPLMYACRRGHLTTVVKLLDLGASVNIRSARETTAFLEAYLQNHEARSEIVKLLLDREDFDVNTPYISELDRTALMIAARSGDEEVVTLLLQRPDIDINHQDQEGCTALSLAIMDQQFTVVELLLDHPMVNINLPNKVGSSPLIIAARSGDADIVDLLMKKGADISIRDHEGGGTALLRAVDEGHTEVIQIFLDHKVEFRLFDEDGRSLLHGASVNGHEEVVDLFLKAGLDKNVRGNRGETPLHDACREGYYDVAKVLLDAGADRTIKDGYARLPADVAWQNGYIRILRLLEGTDNDTPSDDMDFPRPELLPSWSLAKLSLVDLIRQRTTQATSNLSDHDPDTGNTALHFAATNGHQEITGLLLKAKASPDSLNRYKRAPLHLAAFDNKLEIIQILLHNDPKPQLDLRDLWGMTPLDIAQNLRCFYIAVAILDAGAQLNESHRSQIQPTFFAAVELGNAKVVEYLITKGADHLRPNAEGVTVKQIARANDDVAMLRTLDTRESDYFAFRSDSQRSEDYASATSSPYTPSLTSPPNATPPARFGAQPIVSTPTNLEAKASPDSAKVAIRPRPAVAG